MTNATFVLVTFQRPLLIDFGIVGWLGGHGIFPSKSLINWKPTPTKWDLGKHFIGSMGFLGRKFPPLVRSPRFGYYLELSHFGLLGLREMILLSRILGGRKQSARQHLAKSSGIKHLRSPRRKAPMTMVLANFTWGGEVMSSSSIGQMTNLFDISKCLFLA